MGDQQEDIEIVVTDPESADPADPNTRPVGPLHIIEDEKQRAEVVAELCNQYERAAQEHWPRLEKLAKWRTALRARYNDDMPVSINRGMEAPSQVFVPLTRELDNTAFGHLHDALKRDPFWVVSAFNPKDRKKYETLERYLNLLAKDPMDLNLPAKLRESSRGVTGMGTVWAKVPWTTKKRKWKSNSGGTEETHEAITHDGPEIALFPEERVLYRVSVDDVANMPWISFDFLVPWHEIESRGADGHYDADAVATLKDLTEEMAKQRLHSEKVRQRFFDDLGDGADLRVITEFTFFKDIDGDGHVEDLRFSIHVPSGTLMREAYNEEGIRTMEALRFLIPFDQLEGEGTAAVIEDMQDEVNGLHNTRNDNLKFSVQQTLIARRGNVVLGAREPWFPGKVLWADDPARDLAPFSMAGTYPGSLNEEALSQQYARGALGLPPVMAGMADPTLKSRDTAIGSSTRLQEAKGVFGSVVEGIEESWSRIGMFVFYQLVRNRGRVIENERQRGRLTEAEITDLEELLNVKMEDIPHRMHFSIVTSRIDQTFEVQRQNMLTLTQLHTMFTREVLQMGQMLFSPQAQQLGPEFHRFAMELYTDRVKLMRKVAEFFETDPDDLTPNTRKQELMLEMLEIQEAPGIKMLEDRIRQMKEAQSGTAGLVPGMGAAGAGGPGGGPGGPPGLPGPVGGQPGMGVPTPGGGGQG